MTFFSRLASDRTTAGPLGALPSRPHALPGPLDRASDWIAGAPTWLRAAGLGLAMTALTAATTSVIVAGRPDWGPLTTAYAVTTDIGRGELLDASAFEEVQRPIAMLPENFLATPEGRARMALTSGTTLTADHLIGAESSISDVLEKNRAAVPLFEMLTPVEAGQRLSLVDIQTGEVIDATASVMHIEGDVTWVEVANAQAAKIVAADAAGDVGVVLMPTGS